MSTMLRLVGPAFALPTALAAAAGSRADQDGGHVH